MPGQDGNYSGLQDMKSADLKIEARKTAKGKIEVKLKNDPKNAVAFFNRIALIHSKTGERILPAFFSDNYLTVLPGEEKTILVDFPEQEHIPLNIEVYGWNAKPGKLAIGQ